jgi:hypothetical protein
MNKLHYDRLYAKYYPEAVAYKELQAYFLAHPEYTHMVVLPDDLIVRPEDFEQLKADVEQYDYPALAGICHIHYHEKDTFICGPSLNGGPTYFTRETLGQEVRKQGSHIIRVEFEGFACTFIKRDVLVKYPDSIKGMPVGSFDWGFSHSCYWNKVPIHVDTSVYLVHLGQRLPGRQEYWGKGVKQPVVRFEDARGSLIATVKRGENLPDYNSTR